MRYFGKFALAVVTISMFIAGSASAISLTLNVVATFSSSFGPSGATVGPGTITGLVVGDLIQLSIDIDNNTNEQINAIFSTLTIDPALLSLNEPFSSFAATILNVPGTGPPVPSPAQFLGSVGAPEIKAASLPLGDQIQAVAFGSVAGSNGSGTSGITSIFLNVIGAGTFDLNFGFLFSNDLINLAGVESFGAAAASIVSINNPVLAIEVIPEPGTALLMSLGLAGLASAGRRR